MGVDVQGVDEDSMFDWERIKHEKQEWEKNFADVLRIERAKEKIKYRLLAGRKVGKKLFSRLYKKNTEMKEKIERLDSRCSPKLQSQQKNESKTDTLQRRSDFKKETRTKALQKYKILENNFAEVSVIPYTHKDRVINSFRRCGSAVSFETLPHNINKTNANPRSLKCVPSKTPTPSQSKKSFKSSSGNKSNKYIHHRVNSADAYYVQSALCEVPVVDVFCNPFTCSILTSHTSYNNNNINNNRSAMGNALISHKAGEVDTFNLLTHYVPGYGG
jgi:hypothetical protein